MAQTNISPDPRSRRSYSPGNFNTALSPQQEAVRAYRELSSADPIRYRQDLVKALSGEEHILRKLGRDDEADALLTEIRQPGAL